MDAICIGEMLIDFTQGDGERTYVANPGGAPGNVAISMSRNGLEPGADLFLDQSDVKASDLDNRAARKRGNRGIFIMFRSRSLGRR